MRARVSDCTRSTAASAVRPVATASSQPVHPAAVVGEHAVGFEHVAVLAAVGDLAALEQHVEVGAHGLDRRLEALELLRHVVGDEIGDDDARLVQHDVAERDAVVERGAGEVQRPAGGGLGAGLRDARRARPRRSSPASTIAVVCSASSSSSE